MDFIGSFMPPAYLKLLKRCRGFRKTLAIQDALYHGLFQKVDRAVHLSATSLGSFCLWSPQLALVLKVKVSPPQGASLLGFRSQCASSVLWQVYVSIYAEILTSLCSWLNSRVIIILNDICQTLCRRHKTFYRQFVKLNSQMTSRLACLPRSRALEYS